MVAAVGSLQIYCVNADEAAVVAVVGGTAVGGEIIPGALGDPLVKNSGQVAFFAGSYGGPGQGIYLGTPSGVAGVATFGQNAPGGGTFGGFGWDGFALNNNGQVAFGADTEGGPGSGIYVATTASVSSIALQGNQVGGVTIAGDLASAPLALNSQGQVIFGPDINWAGNGIYLGTPAALSTVAAIGGSAPGGGTFSSFSDLGSFMLSLSDSGKVAVGASTDGGPGSGIYVSTNTGLGSAVLEDGTAPSGGTFRNLFGPVLLNKAGNVVFTASTSTGAGGSFLSTRSGVQSLVVDPAAGFAVLYPPTQFNNLGQVAFTGITSSGANGIFLVNGSAIETIATDGETAPGGGTLVLCHIIILG